MCTGLEHSWISRWYIERYSKELGSPRRTRAPVGTVRGEDTEQDDVGSGCLSPTASRSISLWLGQDTLLVHSPLCHSAAVQGALSCPCGGQVWQSGFKQRQRSSHWSWVRQRPHQEVRVTQAVSSVSPQAWCPGPAPCGWEDCLPNKEDPTVLKQMKWCCFNFPVNQKTLVKGN